MVLFNFTCPYPLTGLQSNIIYHYLSLFFKYIIYYFSNIMTGYHGQKAKNPGCMSHLPVRFSHSAIHIACMNSCFYMQLVSYIFFTNMQKHSAVRPKKSRHRISRARNYFHISICIS